MMTNMIGYRLVLLFFVLALGGAASRADEALSRASVMAAFRTVRPGGTLPVAIRFDMAEGWHTYAEEPGDSGMPPSIRMEGPEGVEAGAWRCPPPMAFTDETGTTFGYEKTVALLADVRVPGFNADLPSRLDLVFHVDWMICRDICILRQGILELSVAVGAGNPEPEPGWEAFLRAGGWSSRGREQSGAETPGEEERR